MEKILKISDSADGFKITTNKQEITFSMAMEQCCSETFGYLMSEDNYEDYIGTNLLDIVLTNTALESVELRDIYEGGVIFVNIYTDKGTLQYVAYNEHNGYYGHTVRVRSNQLNLTETI